MARTSRPYSSSYSCSITDVQAGPSLSSVVMSLKRMPSVGKSLISRIFALRAATSMTGVDLTRDTSVTQHDASHQNLGYRAGGRRSEVTVTNSESREEPVTRLSLREYAAVQRERYLAATRAEKGALLNEVVAVTGLHRKAAIRLLRRPPRTP